MRNDRNDEETFTERQRVWPGASGGMVIDLNQPTCHGCLNKPDHECAACGAPANVWTEAGDGRHAVAWCAACHDELVAGRPANAQPLAYLRFAAAVAALPTR